MQKLKGFKDQWRIRIGDWRVLYIIDAETKTVTVYRFQGDGYQGGNAGV